MERVAGVARDWVGCWHPDRLSGLSDLAHVSYVHHTMTGADVGLDGFLAGIRQVFASFPDIEYEVAHAFADGELAAAYVLGEGTHLGAYLGVPATGMTASFRGILHCRVRDGRILEDWDVFDLLTPALRLGATLTT